ncbi:MAG: BMP family ABC transporter substrate-binding protein [Lachnospiraceae bacterium]|nr:BMP family ABC transporter substrate-binding protein [Lachnospiraceae bacterium]
MKKRIISLVLAATMMFSLAACGGGGNTGNTGSGDGGASGATTDVAFVTDVGNIDDHSFNQYSWAGVQQFASDNGLTANYYQPSEDSDAARLEQMDNAVNDGAKAVVMAGYLFGGSLAEAQDKYPDVQFIALDVSTGDLENPGKNTALITYQEEQAGYLAGYAAVTDGYKELGFLGGMDVPAVVRYGYGFVQGAEQAAKDNGVSDVHVKYWYCGGFAPTDDIKAKMDSWYSEGTEVVFACGGGIYLSAIAAAEANNGKVIGVDVDQSADSDLIITSAMKALSNSVILALTDCKDNGWKFSDAYAGKETKLGAADDCVGLPMENSKFTTFSQDQYDKLFASLKDGSLVVDNAIDADIAASVSTISVDVQQ